MKGGCVVFKRVMFWLILPLFLAPSLIAAEYSGGDWTIFFDGFFPYKDRMSPLIVYARETDGQWTVAVGSSRDPLKKGRVKKTYNRSWYCGDLSDMPIKNGHIKGRMVMHMTPDLWVPRDRKSYTVVFDVDAQVEGNGEMTGRYKVVEVNNRGELEQSFGRQGAITGTSKPYTQPGLPEPFTLRCNMQGSQIGGDPELIGRCIVLDLGVENGKLTSAIHGIMSRTFKPEGMTPFDVASSRVAAVRDGFTGKVQLPSVTLDMEPCMYVFDMTGRFHDEVIVGEYTVTVEREGEPDVRIEGGFDGRVNPGVRHMTVDRRPWHVAVKDFKPPEPGEHPRILFRKSDIPALRRKAETPEGRAILRRLRQLLDGADGDKMAVRFSPADRAYDPDIGKKRPWDVPGVYTMGHIVGYGLLYQLTGDREYAELGRQAFDKGIKGIRDRDDRYSFKSPGGALRAGPTIGWYAVGYDLCYDGWDQATRKRLGRAIYEYEKYSDGHSLESLVRGTKPPGSNHFGMQVGGGTLALLALMDESFVDRKKMDMLFKLAELSLIRNISEGFGDGGFFEEGDGTGSMASQIAYLTALQGWRNARGQDFINVERPNVRMLTLKWIYQTVVDDGNPSFWPIRGAYGHNVWAREGLSGGGYFAIGLGSVTQRDRAVMKWYYEQYLLEVDAAKGCGYDTVTRYPHIATCAFVNWPVDLPAKPAGKVLPHCYTDSTCGFYVWRNRWRDGNDTVISGLSNRTQGYMGSKPDKQFRINSKGKRISWGRITEGKTRHWSHSPMGETSSLTLSDGSCIAVDFTGASGSDTMLVTTVNAEGQNIHLDGQALTFYFPTADTPPKVEVAGGYAVAGRQKVRMRDGNLVLEVKGN